MPTNAATLAHLGREVKFGRRAATPEQLRKIVPLKPFVRKYGGKPPPSLVVYGDKAQASLSEMLGNDQYGNCVIVAGFHGVGVWSANEPGGREAIGTTQEAVNQYVQICGRGDNGCYIPAVLNHFRDRGLTVAGKTRKLVGYVSCDPRDQLLVKIATHLFGGLHLGVNWPGQWMQDARPGGVLRPGPSNIVGGHAIQVVGYNAIGLQVSTWGIVCTLSWEALADRRYVDECYACLGEDWFNESGATAVGEGVDVEALREALRVIAGGGTPVIPDDPTPPLPPTPPTPDGRDVTLDGYLTVLNQQLPIHLVGKLSASARGEVGAVPWMVLVWDVIAIINALRARDWVALLAAVEKLLADLGEQFTADERHALASALQTSADTLPLATPSEEPLTAEQ